MLLIEFPDTGYNEAKISPASLKRTEVRKISTAEIFLLMRYKDINKIVNDGG